MLKNEFMTTLLETGTAGEHIATFYLKSIGYKIYDRNVRIGRDEIDIIAYDPTDNVLVFAEVKSRTKSHVDYPSSLNMTSQKKQKLFRSARGWIAKHDFQRGYRIDAILIEKGSVKQHIRELSEE